MALQTREQHIRREKATSNICTAQALLAITASFYAVHHGPEGLRAIARRVNGLARTLQRGLSELGCAFQREPFFDTFLVGLPAARAESVLSGARARGYDLRPVDARTLGIALDETAAPEDVEALLTAFAEVLGKRAPAFAGLAQGVTPGFAAPHARTSAYLTHPVFHEHRVEHELLRYIKRLEARDLSLTTSMIPLGSCTMKLNAAAEMLPITWPELSALHPFAPSEDTAGYREIFQRLEKALAEITGFAAG